MKKLNPNNRVILLVDIDSFSVQLLQKSFPPETADQPCVVALPGDDAEVRLSAINYEAKAMGIERRNTVQEAIVKCPNVNVLRFPALAGNPKKPDFAIQEQATKDLAAAVEYCNSFEANIRPILHMASIDEFYLDVTALVESIIVKDRAESADGQKEVILPEDLEELKYKFIIEDLNGPISVKDWKPNFVKHSLDEKLFHGFQIACKVVQIVREQTKMNASVGIGSNKLIAKLACGLNKPLAVTLVFHGGFTQISKRIPIPNVPCLGGAAGKAIMKNLKTMPEEGGGEGGGEPIPVQHMGDLISFTMEQIASIRLKDDEARLIGTVNGRNIYDTVHGIDDSQVTQKLKYS